MRQQLKPKCYQAARAGRGKHCIGDNNVRNGQLKAKCIKCKWLDEKEK